MALSKQGRSYWIGQSSGFVGITNMYLQFGAGNKCEVTVVALNKFLTEDCPTLLLRTGAK